MALPVAHLAVALGGSRSNDSRSLLVLALLAIAPDFDFVLVWGWGLPIEVYHRTFSHSLAAGLVVALVYAALRPAWLRLSPWLVLAVYLSHPLVDMLCTADAADHGVMFLWPFSQERYGWAILVPLYIQFAESPFSLSGAFRFTLLEMLLAAPLWAGARLIREAALHYSGRPAAVSGSSTSQSHSGNGRSRGAISSRLSP